MSSLYRLSLTGMLEAIGCGSCSADDIWASCRGQIERHEPVVHAWKELQLNTAYDESLGKRKLSGLPIGVKDTIDVYGLCAERGSVIWQGRKPQTDAACISMLQQIGARVMGKTVTTEFAYFAPGPTVNPHCLTHTPGGSSSGSAAAVATGMVPLALGSQTAASVIRPAAYCGVVGYVATVGNYASRGIMPLSHTFDSLGFFARDVADLLYVHGLLNRVANVAQLEGRPQSGVLAIDGSDFGTVEPEMLALHQRAVDTLRSHGVPVQCGSDQLFGALDGSAWVEAHRRMMAYESAQTLSFEYNVRRELLSPMLCALIEEGLEINGAQYDALRQQRDDALTCFISTMCKYDAILAPAAPGAAPEGLAATGRPDQSRPWQWLGVPQITLPVGLSEQGLPLGLQLVGMPRRDYHLLQIANWMQNELGWQGCIPAQF